MFIATCIGTPILQASVLGGLWFRPLSLRTQAALLRFCEAVVSWEFTAVYIIAVLLTLTQLADVSKMMVQPHCGSLDEPLARVAQAGFIAPEHATCFQLRGTLESGFWVILVGSFILNFSTQLLLRAARCLVADRAGSPLPEADLYYCCCAVDPWEWTARRLWRAATRKVSGASVGERRAEAPAELAMP